jgi:hypothetical protein
MQAAGILSKSLDRTKTPKRRSRSPTPLPRSIRARLARRPLAHGEELIELRRLYGCADEHRVGLAAMKELVLELVHPRLTPSSLVQFRTVVFKRRARDTRPTADKRAERD